MLDTLRRLIQELNLARNLDQALGLIVRRVKEIAQADVCSVFLAEPDGQHYVLKASDGLKPEAIGRIRLGRDEGLIGLVAQRAEPVNLEDAPLHPRYRYFPDSGEERYHAFLGVPIIHHRDVVGVLVAQRTSAEVFDEESVTLLVTVAAQLAGAIAHAELSGELNGFAPHPPRRKRSRGPSAASRVPPVSPSATPGCVTRRPISMPFPIAPRKTWTTSWRSSTGPFLHRGHAPADPGWQLGTGRPAPDHRGTRGRVPGDGERLSA